MDRILIALWLMLGLVTVEAARANEEYRLSSGDRLRVVVFGEESLSGEFEVDGLGTVALPLIGSVDAGGRTVREFERVVGDAFRGGYLVNPRISVEVLNYRPFYIVGEVNNPGSYSFRAGMTLLNAVAMAGGFTYRADEDDVEITRGDGAPAAATIDTPIMPGDIVRVGERLF